ncbi:GNAT family N-acetyltransferase [Falsibacillus pallidus]|uniref:Ribosomal protein S18 acetylase RimI-like enzyme n=1 Tax=Falsibacillus pallidus TaxID=493781 RepID=A0A370FXV4_9BACI|nr:GNAT family N-acetyltransferase [Falsibacillus pallidus]RDI36447.1 ribosomal protein S18 acetylase RimI-like enzyme [Falsibacillus pallidus]
MIELRPMTPEQYEKYLEKAIQKYAQEKTASGNWKAEEALQKSTDEYQRLLPDGVQTENNYLYSAYDGDLNTGIIWIAKKEQAAYIYDVYIFDEYQGKGYGKAVMSEIETKAKELGINKMRLHVFGHNTRARGLYEKIGYQPTNINMEKKL